MSASTDGIADARHGDAAHARVGVVLGERVQRLEVGRIELVNRFDADVGIGMGGLGLRAELIENSHWVFQTPAAPHGPAGAFLSVCYFK